MKIKHQLSLATLLMAGVFVTGCSQQEASGGSQGSGGSQESGGSQVSGGSQQQVEGGSQVSGSQQQVEAAAPVVAAPIAAAPIAAAPAPVAAAPARAPVNRWFHYHPEAPACALTKSHAHKYTNRNHRHHYSCDKMAQKAQPAQVDVYALQRKLKAKGYYKGPIDGIVGPGTRSALQRFMKR